MRVAPALFAALPLYLGDSGRPHWGEVGPPDTAGWVQLTLMFDSFYAARARLLGLGGDVEVLEPAALRLSLVDFAEQIVARHQ